MVTLIRSSNIKLSGNHLVKLVKCKDCTIGGVFLEGEHSGIYDASNGNKISDLN